MSISHLLNQSISVRNPSGTRDLHGKRALGTATTVRARFERTNKTIVTAEREREPIDGIVFVGPSATVEIGAKVTYDGTDYRVMTRSDVVVGSGGLHHYELMVQLWSYA